MRPSLLLDNFVVCGRCHSRNIPTGVAGSDVTKAKRLSYWTGLFCVAVLVLMPDITVNAQPDPDGQGPNGQMPNEVGQGTDTQTPAEQPTSEDPQPPEKKQTSEEQEPSNEVGQGTDTQTPAEQQTSEDRTSRLQAKAYPTEEEQRQAKQRKSEEGQRLLDAGCQIGETRTDPRNGRF